MHRCDDPKLDRVEGGQSPRLVPIHQDFPIAYGEIRRIAHRLFEHVPPDLTLQPTDVIHEAYLRIANSTPFLNGDASHLRAISSIAMRHILIDYLRTRNAQKRGGGQHRVPLAGHFEIHGKNQCVDLVDLIDAMERLAELSTTQSTVLELRFFGQMSIAEIARTLGMTERSVRTESQMAFAWLRARLGTDR